MKIHGATDIGLVRSQNEDSYLVDAPILAVADGMGGHAGGEVASQEAIRTISRLRRGKKNTEPESFLRTVFAEANRRIVHAARSDKTLAGMGTTLTVAIIGDDWTVIGHAGDSRAYLCRQGALQRLTRDHSLVADLVESGQITEAEAERHPMRSVITRALGIESEIKVDIVRKKLSPGDRLMLCSDGLNAVLSSEKIRVILATASTPRDACDELIGAARAAGGPDNITVTCAFINHHPVIEAN